MGKLIEAASYRAAIKYSGIGFASLIVLCFTLPSDAFAANNHLSATQRIAAPSGARSLCENYKWACTSARNNVDKSVPEGDIVKKVNRKINRSVREISDQRQYRRVEFWALPTSRGGDCEDFALIKKQQLQLRGIDPKRLLLATVFDRNRNSHAVLIYRARNGDFVLDNLTNKILNWKDTGYIFLRMQDPNEPRQWVTGFDHS